MPSAPSIDSPSADTVPPPATTPSLPATTADGLSLVLVSFLGLFYELALIRWFPANVLSLAYFSNIVLISCFLGFGLGCLLSHRRDLFVFFPWLVLLIVAAAVSFRLFTVSVPATGDEWIWSRYTGNARLERPFRIGITSALLAVYLLNAVLFVPIGQKMAVLMARFPPLKAYCLNIVGSILGIVAFGVFPALGHRLNSPLWWFALAGGVTLWFFRGRVRPLAVAALPLLAACLTVGYSAREEIWSPYYSIQLRDRNDGEFGIYVNRFFHQLAANFATNARVREKYSIPYQFKVPQRLLILGAGTGNDVAAAVASGVPHVDAVELDPTIAELGRARHPSSPYSHISVRVIVDDARSYLQRTGQQYDMIIFGTLDSHALLSGMSTVRLDNFVYTMECLRSARARLTPDGIAVLLFSVPEPWLGARLLEMCVEAFPDSTPLVHLSDGELFNTLVLAGPGLTQAAESFQGDRSQFNLLPRDNSVKELPTDDWPYLYLAKRGIPTHYMKTIALLLLLSAIAVYRVAPGPQRRIDLRFFCLGAAFMLLETKSVTTLSLLFGSTWLVNAFVFGTILTMILLANLWLLRKPLNHLNPVFLCLGVSLILNYLLPAGTFLSCGFWTRSLASSSLTALPLFFAAIIFGTMIQKTSDIGFAYGANLLGAVLGGFLEYASMIVGLNALYLLAGLLYLAAFMEHRRREGRTKLAPAAPAPLASPTEPPADGTTPEPVS